MQAFETAGVWADLADILEDKRPAAFLALPPILRVLLTTDGTVTKTLEAYFCERVEVRRVAQRLQPLGQALPALELGEGAEVLGRRVQLCGATSDRLYAQAESFICPQALPEAHFQALLEGSMGIGEIIRESGLESYRKLVAMNLLGDQDMQRAYVIVIGGRPAIWVSESFPLALFSS